LRTRFLVPSKFSPTDNSPYHTIIVHHTYDQNLESLEAKSARTLISFFPHSGAKSVLLRRAATLRIVVVVIEQERKLGRR
jgi:prolyl-tRNA editing enzyme YbaK/EbsC (Cys-tRNA(Pro) deacylase)